MPVKLKDIMKKISEFEKNTITSEELKSYLEENIKPEVFIATGLKSMIANKAYEKVMVKYKSGEGAAEFGAEVHFYISFLIMMAYGNISYTDKDIKISTYDKLCSYGVRKYIMQFAGDDYKEIYDILRFMTDFMFYDSINRVVNITEMKKLDGVVKELGDMLSNPEKISLLKDIIAFNNSEKKVKRNK